MRHLQMGFTKLLFASVLVMPLTTVGCGSDDPAPSNPSTTDADVGVPTDGRETGPTTEAGQETSVVQEAGRPDAETGVLPDAIVTPDAETSVVPGDADAAEVIVGITATPTFEPLSGNSFTGKGSVTIKSSTEGAVIRYTTDGSEPNASSAIYTAPIEITRDATIKAFAIAPSYSQSAVTTATYVVKPEVGKPLAPKFEPEGGTFSNTVRLAISSDRDATICFTTNGNDPGCSTTGASAVCTGTAVPYTTMIEILGGAAGTTAINVKALACRVGAENTDIISKNYSFVAAAPTSTVAAGTFPPGPQNPRLATTTVGGEIRYTLDGTDPNCSTSDVITSAVGALPAAITSNTVLKAITCKVGYQASPVASFDYRIQGVTPAIAPAVLTQNTAFDVSITAADPTICYTLNGTAPTCTVTGTTAACGAGSTPYTAAFRIEKNAGLAGTNVRAVACGPQHVASAAANVTYKLKEIDPLVVPADTAVVNANFDATITNPNANSYVCWSTDGTTPACAKAGEGTCSALSEAANATKVVALVPGSTFQVVACRKDQEFEQSAIVTRTYRTANQLGLTVKSTDSGNNLATGCAAADGHCTNYGDGTQAFTRDQAVTMTASPVDALICYTTSATVAPACNTAKTDCATGSTKYTAPVTVATDGAVIRAIACKPSAVDSVPFTHTLHFRVGTPTIAPDDLSIGVGGPPSIPWGQAETFDSITPAAGRSFNYTFGTNAQPGNPTCALPLPPTTKTGSGFTVNQTAGDQYFGKVIGCKTGYKESEVLSNWGYRIIVGAPTILPPDSSLYNPKPITLQTVSNAEGHHICYTVDGTEPRCNATTFACESVQGGTTYQGVSGLTIPMSGTGTGVRVWDQTVVRARTCIPNIGQSLETLRAGGAAGELYTLKVTPAAVTPTVDQTDLLDCDAGGTECTMLGANKTRPFTLKVGLKAGVEASTDTVVCYAFGGNPQLKSGAGALNDNCEAVENSGTRCVAPGTDVSIITDRVIRAQSCKLYPDLAVGTKRRLSAIAEVEYNGFTTYAGNVQLNSENNFVDAEKLGSTTAGNDAYVSWNTNDIFVGIAGTSVATTGNSNVVSIYLGNGTGGTTVPVVGLAAGGQVLPAGAKVHLGWVASTQTLTVSSWNGTAWVNDTVASGVRVYNTAAGFVKFAIPRTYTPLSISGADSTLVAFGGVWNGSATTVAFPVGTPALSKYLSANLSSFYAPANAANIKP